MTLELLVLCLAAFGLVAGAVSGLISLSLPMFDRISVQLRTRHRVGLWFGLGALPALVAVFTIGVSFFPALGLAHDHCLNHGLHHPHLCSAHVGEAPGLILVFIAGFVAIRALSELLRLARTARLSQTTARSLAEGSTQVGDQYVFPSDHPDAFVVGFFCPRVFVSRALLSLGSETSDPVIAHERVHASRRDSLWRCVASLLSLGHLPSLAAHLRARLVTAQEFTADEEGALSLPNGRLKMADAILTLAKSRQTLALGLSFTDGDLRTRIATLLYPPRSIPTWPAHVLLLCAVALPLIVGASHDLIHHELETVLGALS